MSIPILTTKLHIPSSLPTVVKRSHLIKQLDDGLLGITLEAQTRFRVVNFSERENTLLEGEVEWLTDRSTKADESFAMLQALLERILDHYQIEVSNLKDKLSDANWLSYRLSEYLPLDASVKQDLLEQPDSLARLSELERILGDNALVDMQAQ